MPKNIAAICTCIFLSTFSGISYSADENPSSDACKSPDPGNLIGRWDITLKNGEKHLPSWLEVEKSGFKTLVGRYVDTIGSARPISRISLSHGRFEFSIPPQWSQGDKDMHLEGAIAGDEIEGIITTSDGKRQTFKGQRAPCLRRTQEPAWAEPVELFNAKNLAGWKSSLPDNQWKVVNGILTSDRSGANLISEQVFGDFKLHVEFKYPKNGNSGIYLRGRHEVQIADSSRDSEPGSTDFSAIYGFIAPSELNTRGADAWQEFDITLIGRQVTVIANGKTVISNQAIPGVTGGALDSHEAEKGPIYLQGDHTAIAFRKIVITPAK
ncbi:3-keto-disaccharide hydrolase [Comamonas composti]|uniref:3-keto-disaccharide hydrolase n=1 Tax=Comamonas composti TaxID=408558 RepID=UPI00040539B2|nr:DUF1080 domain-containing protein [Comamonas composti]